ncbi:Transcriptional regulator, contains XRE-family HTH domain [Carboxydocella thermautotrophica]|nr:Transcriptional regulator, contains XRE-family HTH domain [Carboxydocella thermautotrophica]
MDKLGEYIRNKRKERGLSLRECARMCDISHSYLDSLEKGKDPRTNKPVSPTIDTLKKISKGLGVPINELLEAADIKTDPNHCPDEMEAIEECPPSDLDLEKILLESNVMFNGEPLDEEDKQDIIEFLKVAWKTIRKKKGRGV